MFARRFLFYSCPQTFRDVGDRAFNDLAQTVRRELSSAGPVLNLLDFVAHSLRFAPVSRHCGL